MLKLISVNIEADKHFDFVLPFLQRENPDVCAVQEILDEHIQLFTEKTGMACVGFSPMALQPSFLDKSGPKDKKWGIALFSRLPIVETGEVTYVGDQNVIPVFSKAANEFTDPNSSNYVLRWMRIMHKEKMYTIATTHFSWTPQGVSTPYQLVHLDALFKALQNLHDDFVLCGDFNAPRGLETWSRLSAQYTDNIPEEYKTSIDLTFHRNGKTRAHELADKMVDGLFTTTQYKASNVYLVDGVSDHMAIVANIEKI